MNKYLFPLDLSVILRRRGVYFLFSCFYFLCIVVLTPVEISRAFILSFHEHTFTSFGRPYYTVPDDGIGSRAHVCPATLTCLLVPYVLVHLLHVHLRTLTLTHIYIISRE